jgi:hypothetical protein
MLFREGSPCRIAPQNYTPDVDPWIMLSGAHQNSLGCSRNQFNRGISLIYNELSLLSEAYSR